MGGEAALRCSQASLHWSASWSPHPPGPWLWETPMGSDPRGLPRCIHQAGKKELQKGRERTPCLTNWGLCLASWGVGGS